MHVGRLHARRGTVFTPHAHPCQELIVPLRGGLRARLGGRSTEGRPGDALWYPRAGEHHESVAPDGAADWLYVLIEAPHRLDALPLRIADRDGVVRQLAALIAAERGTGAASIAKRDALATAAVAELQRLAAQAAATDDGLVAAVEQFIQRHLSEPLSLERLARAAGVSRAHVARRFRAGAGRTPMEAVRSARLAAARELLLTTDLTLRAIAPRVGIGSEFLLSRLLSRHLGVGARTLRRGRRRIGLS